MYLFTKPQKILRRGLAFYMLVPYGNAFCISSLQVLWIKNNFYIFSYD